MNYWRWEGVRLIPLSSFVASQTQSPTSIDIDFKGDIEKQKKNGELLQKIANIQAVGIRDDLAELWALSTGSNLLKKKNKLLEAIQKGKIIDDRAAYLAGIFKKKGWV